MALNIVSSGEYKPFCKYNAKAGRWYFRKDEQETELASPTFIVDFDNIKTGWFLFLEGQAPNIVYDPSISNQAARPSEVHKRGFEVNLFSPNLFGGVATLSGASMHLNNAINDVYVAYEAGKAANAGMVPVVSCTGTTPMKDKMGTNYRPILSIVKWVPRPAELDGYGQTVSVPVANVPPAQPPAVTAPVSSVSEF